MVAVAAAQADIMWLTILYLSLSTSAISVTISRGSIFNRLRASSPGILGELLSCFYCLSHWVALLLVLVYQPLIVRFWMPLDLFLSAMAVTCVSGVISSIFIFLVWDWRELLRHESRPAGLQEMVVALESAKATIESQQKLIHELERRISQQEISGGSYE